MKTIKTAIKKIDRSLVLAPVENGKGISVFDGEIRRARNSTRLVRVSKRRDGYTVKRAVSSRIRRSVEIEHACTSHKALDIVREELSRFRS